MDGMKDGEEEEEGSLRRTPEKRDWMDCVCRMMEVDWWWWWCVDGWNRGRGGKGAWGLPLLGTTVAESGMCILIDFFGRGDGESGKKEEK